MTNQELCEKLAKQSAKEIFIEDSEYSFTTDAAVQPNVQIQEKRQILNSDLYRDINHEKPCESNIRAAQRNLHSQICIYNEIEK